MPKLSLYSCHLAEMSTMPITLNNISMLSCRAVPGSTRNPFLMPTGQLCDSCDFPPHLGPPFPREQTNMQLIPKSVGSSSSDEEQSLPHRSKHAVHTAKFNDIYYDCDNPMFLDPHDDQDIIKEKTMAGVPTWPTNLCLSLNANNWLEWSHEILNNLKMAQLDVYPAGLLPCPDSRLDHTSH
jgi:hypothetical protein